MAKSAQQGFADRDLLKGLPLGFVDSDSAQSFDIRSQVTVLLAVNDQHRLHHDPAIALILQVGHDSKYVFDSVYLLGNSRMFTAIVPISGTRLPLAPNDVGSESQADRDCGITLFHIVQHGQNRFQGCRIGGAEGRQDDSRGRFLFALLHVRISTR